jgi:pyrroloquinoline quinone biosynthesis protein B
MHLILLGTAAGGGFPQWNCGCTNCNAAREGRLRPRTQDSIAVSADGETWALLNASPDIHRQIERNARLHPRAPRHSPIRAIALANGDLDHVLGLFSLREWHPFTLFATDAVHAGLQTNAMMRTLQRTPEQLTLRRLVLHEETPLLEGLTIRAIPLPGKPPLHLVGTMAPSPQDNVALVIAEGRKRVIYASACADSAALLPHVEGADVLLFDGTFHRSDELARAGLGTARAEEMAHAPVIESLAAFEHVRIGRKLLVHINNSNPLLDPTSPERRAVEALGWELPEDGTTFEL